MTSRLDSLLEHIGKLERELEAELDRRRVQWRYRIEAGRVRFEREAHLAHRRLKQSIPRFLRESSVRTVLTAPLIYSLVVPIALLDAWISVYQAICFRAYGIERVRRSRYVIVDRQHLAYLNSIEKLNCVYCGYANGVIAYVRRSPAGPNSIGVRFGMRSGSAARMRHTTAHFVDYRYPAAYRRMLIPCRHELQDKRPAGEP
jgi:hypothetical protein